MHIFLNTFETITGLPNILGYVLFFIIGAAVGSFLNVVIHRIPKGKSIVFPNSACPKCQKPIKPYDNIPILSWLILTGKCRSCKNPISPRYPAVELLTALLFILIVWQIGFTLFLPVALIFISTIVALIFVDAENMSLPDVITFPLLVFSFLVRIIFSIFSGVEYFPDIQQYPLDQLSGMPLWAISIAGAVLGGLVGGGSLWLIGKIWKIIRKMDAMGLGDVKMMFGVGALIGWRFSVVAIFIAVLIGAVVGVLVILRQKERDFQTQIPFGIFLGIGSITALLYGEQLIRWYIQNFVP